MSYNKLIFSLLFFISFSVVAETNIESLSGAWSKYCDEDGYGYSAIIHSNKNELVIKISSGQVHINSIAKKVQEKGIYKLYFLSPNDMGPGGMKYDWSKVSKTIPIAEIHIATPKRYSMKWFGIFYDKSKKMELSTEFTYDNILSECVITDY
jgi:hypothetical protein